MTTEELRKVIANWEDPPITVVPARVTRRRNPLDTQGTWDPFSPEAEEGLTVEEQAIRWAARNGGAINL